MKTYFYTMLVDSLNRVIKFGFEIFSIDNKWILGRILFCTVLKAKSEKGIVKKHLDHLQKKEIPIKDEIHPEVQLEKRDLDKSSTIG